MKAGTQYTCVIGSEITETAIARRNPNWRLGQQEARKGKGKRSKRLTLDSDLKPRRQKMQLTGRKSPWVPHCSEQQHEPRQIGVSATKTDKVETSRNLPMDSKGAIKPPMKTIENFKGVALKVRVGL